MLVWGVTSELSLMQKLLFHGTRILLIQNGCVGKDAEGWWYVYTRRQAFGWEKGHVQHWSHRTNPDYHSDPFGEAQTQRPLFGIRVKLFPYGCVSPFPLTEPLMGNLHEPGQSACQTKRGFCDRAIRDTTWGSIVPTRRSTPTYTVPNLVTGHSATTYPRLA